MRPTQKGGSVVEESTLSTGLALHKQQQQQQQTFRISTPKLNHKKIDMKVVFFHTLNYWELQC